MEISNVLRQGNIIEEAQYLADAAYDSAWERCTAMDEAQNDPRF